MDVTTIMTPRAGERLELHLERLICALNQLEEHVELNYLGCLGTAKYEVHILHSLVKEGVGNFGCLETLSSQPDPCKPSDQPLGVQGERP